MLKIAVSFFALAAAAIASAQPPQGAPTPEQLAAMPPETRAIAEASMAFGNCIRVQVTAAGAGAAANADAVAGAALSACQTQRAAVEAAAERLIASPMVPDAAKAQAREQLRQQMAGLQGMIATQIRSSGAGAAAQPPAQAPARPAN
jgi:hypothetical protein